MGGHYKFDHLAIGVERWRDGFPRFAGEFGGRWSHGGDSDEFAAGQLVYAHDMRLELITPGPGGEGFMRRFLDRSGPGPHHLTFKVPSLDDTLGEMAERGIGTLGGRNDTPVWREAFLHPKQAGLGTLIQLAQTNDALIATMMGPQVTPDGYPAVPGEQASIAWIGLAVESAPAARELLTEVLHGELMDGGPGWARLEWGTGHALVLRDGSAAPGGPGLWPEGRLGVTHVMFGPAGLEPGARCQRLADDPLTGVPVFVADSARGA